MPTPYIPRRRELDYPRLDARDRPAADELADPHRNRRAKPRTTTPKEETKMTDHDATESTPPGPCPDCAPSDSVEFTLSSPGVWVLESAARTPPKPRAGPCPRCGANPATTTQAGA